MPRRPARGRPDRQGPRPQWRGLVDLWSDRTDRLDPGPSSRPTQGSLVVVAAPARTRAASSSPSRASSSREEAEGLRGLVLPAEPSGGARALWIDELVGAVVELADGTRRRRRRGGRGQPGQRPAGARGRRLIPLRFVTSHEPGDADGHRACPRASSSSERSAHRRLHALPRADRPLLRGDDPRPGPGARGSWRSRPSTCATAPRTSAGRSTTRPSAAGRAWCSARADLPRRRGPRAVAGPARPLIAVVPHGAALRPGRGRTGSSGLESFTLLCGRYEGIDQRVLDELVDDELCMGDFVLAGGRAGRPRRDRGDGPAAARGARATRPRAWTRASRAGLLEYPQ